MHFYVLTSRSLSNFTDLLPCGSQLCRTVCLIAKLFSCSKCNRTNMVMEEVLNNQTDTLLAFQFPCEPTNNSTFQHLPYFSKSSSLSSLHFKVMWKTLQEETDITLKLYVREGNSLHCQNCCDTSLFT